MTVRELIKRMVDHGADGHALNDEVLVKINGDVRPITVSYSNGTLVLVAGPPIHHP